MTKAFFCRLSSRPIPRVLRMMDVATDLGYETLFISARREKDMPTNDTIFGHSVLRAGKFFPLLNGKSALTYIGGVIGYNFSLAKILFKQRPSLVHCSDIETVPVSILYKVLFRKRLIYNIHDNLSQRYNISTAPSAILNFMEGVVVLLSDQTLVPEKFRRESLPKWCQRKVEIVRNTPVDKGVAPLPKMKAPIRIFFGGWLDRGRGLLQLLDLVKCNKDFELVIAGEGEAELVELVKQNPRTKFLGFISHEEIMEETAKCHFVSALYDPIRPINKSAASNKLAEALSRGRPALINSEMLIVKDLEPYNCVLQLPYSDIQNEAAAMLRSLVIDDPKRYSQLSKDSRRAYEELYGWETAYEAMKKALVN